MIRVLMYKGSEDGLQGWVRQHFPAFSRWLDSLSPEEAWCDYDLEPEYIEQVLTLNHVWPEADVLLQRFSACWADQVVYDMVDPYTEFIDRKALELANPSMLSAHAYEYTTARLIASYCRDDVLSTWMATVNSRALLEPDSPPIPLKYKGFQVGYWDAAETRWMAKQLLPLYEDLKQHRKKGLHRFDAFLEGELEMGEAVLFRILEACKAVGNKQGLIFTCS